MRHQDYLQISCASSKEEFKGALIAFAHKMEFGVVSAGLGADVPLWTSDVEFVHNTPAAFQQVSSDFNATQRCPVTARLRVAGLPFVYDKAFFEAHGSGDLWEEAAPFGFKTGLAMSMRLPHGRRFVFGFDRDAPLPTDDRKSTQLLAHFQLAAAHACDAAVRILHRAHHQHFTRREREVLDWAAQGKSIWETARILGISESTTSKHLDSAIRRLNCVNKTQAVAVALRLQAI
jgi:DNA-binding CsgD family transcriptional regulator